MNPDVRDALSDYLLAMADDELILGHRDSEWTGHAPILEEDIAFANIALDEIGHATVWYGLLAELHEEDPETYPDKLVFHRDAKDFRCAQLVELDKGDWALSMMRQFLFDMAESNWLARLTRSDYRPLAEAAAKIGKEEIYHLRHTQAWIHRLGLGTDESRKRMQKALNKIWPYSLQLFELPEGYDLLMEEKILPQMDDMKEAWILQVGQKLEEAGLKLPRQRRCTIDGRDEHTDSFEELIKNMQQVARLDPRATW